METPTNVNSEILDKLPPNDNDAEQGTTGSLILDPRLCDDVALIVRPEDFYAEANQKLFSHVLAMHQQGEKIDPVLLSERLKREGDWEAIGGAAYLYEVIGSVPYAYNAVYYAKIVRDKAKLRSLIHAGTEIIRNAYNAGNPDEALETAEQLVFRIRDRHIQDRVQTVSSGLRTFFDEMDAHEQGRGDAAVPTGFADLDTLLAGGFRSTDLVVVAARTGVGKTAMALNIAKNAAMQHQIPTLFFSLEMSVAALIKRLVCSVARVNGHRLDARFLSKDDRQRIVEAAAELDRAPLFFNDTPGRSMTEIAACCRREKRKHGIGLVIVDYVGFIRPHNTSVPRQEQVAAITAALKQLARELEVPVIAVAQLNRRAEDGRKPQLHHLRESGALEMDPDIVMLLHRPWVTMTASERQNSPEMKQQAEINVAKHRNGPTGEVALAWFEEQTRFETLADPWQHTWDGEAWDEASGAETDAKMSTGTLFT